MNGTDRRLDGGKTFAISCVADCWANRKRKKWISGEPICFGCEMRIERRNRRFWSKLRINVKVIRVNWYYPSAECVAAFSVNEYSHRMACLAMRGTRFRLHRCNKSNRTRETWFGRHSLSGNRLIYVIWKFRKLAASLRFSEFASPTVRCHRRSLVVIINWLLTHSCAREAANRVAGELCDGQQ